MYSPSKIVLDFYSDIGYTSITMGNGATSLITKQDVLKAVNSWPCLYEDKNGQRFTGAPVSTIASLLRDIGWKNVGRIDKFDLRDMGVMTTTARYVGGARPKRFCDVIVLRAL